ncbi:hypothetical protein [Azospirillum argentinense]|uniref:hypothetical protein n=1 Tax=Azospirillum argentinense TaxID=2970906 RepID=UPI0032DFBCE7
MAAIPPLLSANDPGWAESFALAKAVREALPSPCLLEVRLVADPAERGDPGTVVGWIDGQPGDRLRKGDVIEFQLYDGASEIFSDYTGEPVHRVMALPLRAFGERRSALERAHARAPLPWLEAPPYAELFQESGSDDLVARWRAAVVGIETLATLFDQDLFIPAGD